MMSMEPTCNAMLLLTAIACLILPASLQDTSEVPQEFSLISSPGNEVVKHFTKDVKLLCKNQDSGQSKFNEIFTIRIEKQSKDTGSWEHIADIIENSESPTIEDPNVSVRGKITHEIVGSYIEVSWALASDDSIGIYRCDIAGVNKDLDIVSERTLSIEIKIRDLSASEAFDMLLHEIQSNKDDIRHKNDKIDEIIEEVLNNTNEIDEMRMEVSNNTDNIMTMMRQFPETNADFKISDIKVDSMGNRLQEVENKFNTKWPRGQYVLLQPNTGCPNDPAFVEGEVGVKRFHTESSSGVPSKTIMSKNIHLSTPIVEREGSANFLNLRFCPASVAVSSVHWPRGSYCINRYTGDCPLGFLNGTSDVWLDEEDTNYNVTWQGSFFWRAPGFLYFCCTNNAPPYNIVFLPTNSPFYLYRFGGQCQQVYGMSVTEEFIEIDTEDTGNADVLAGSFHPDGSLDNSVGSFRLELCYYQ